MAAHSRDEEDGSCDLAFDGSHFKLVKPSFDEVNQQCSLDVVPIPFEENSFSVEENCSVQAAHGQDVYSISMLSEEDETNPKFTSQLAFLSFVELPVSPKKQMSLDSLLNCQNLIGLQMESTNAYSPCDVDIDIEMKNFEKPKSDDKTIGSIKSDGLPTGVLQRQASIKTSGKLMQLLKDHGSTLVKMISKQKSFNERIYDTPNNKGRKYKRAVSFDSRKVVLLFSILLLYAYSQVNAARLAMSMCSFIFDNWLAHVLQLRSYCLLFKTDLVDSYIFMKVGGFMFNELLERYLHE